MNDHEPRVDQGLTGIPAHFAVLVRELRGLVRAELALAREEMSQGAARMAIGVSMIVGAAIFAFVGFIVLAAAAALALNAWGVPLIWSVFIVGMAALFVSALLAFMGVRRIKPDGLIPKRAMANLHADLKSATEVPNARPY